MTDQILDDAQRVKAWRLLAGNPVTVLSAVVLLAVIVIALTASWICLLYTSPSPRD